jgi:hypothetical protein
MVSASYGRNVQPKLTAVQNKLNSFENVALCFTTLFTTTAYYAMMLITPTHVFKTSGPDAIIIFFFVTRQIGQKARVFFSLQDISATSNIYEQLLKSAQKCWTRLERFFPGIKHSAYLSGASVLKEKSFETLIPGHFFKSWDN